MKLYCLPLALLCSISISVAQTNTFPPNADVGIGTLSPLAKLHVNGIMRLGGDATDYLYSGQDGIGRYFEQVGSDAPTSRMRFQSSVKGSLSNYSVFSIDPEKGFSFFSWGAGNSNVSVNGNIRAREIKVENSNWPDYVFAKSYQLPSLLETEKHIKEKGHLPGIPSAEEVRNKGVELGEMNAKLLQKIEELTLHLIEMRKELDAIKASSANKQQ